MSAVPRVVFDFDASARADFEALLARATKFLEEHESEVHQVEREVALWGGSRLPRSVENRALALAEALRYIRRAVDAGREANRDTTGDEVPIG